MKTIKLLIIVALLMPLVANAQSSRSASSAAQTEDSKYPRYNDSEAAQLWMKWKRNEPFTQSNYARVIDLCDASFEYLADEIQNIIATSTTQTQRNKKALTLDTGITSNMSNFSRTFAIRVQNLAAKGKLNPENTHLVAEMLKKKKRYMELNQQMYHPN